MRYTRVDLDRPNRCAHEWKVWRTADDQLAARATDERHLTCVYCGERLPFGESNDSDPRVAVEIRAVELTGADDDEFTQIEYAGWNGDEVARANGQYVTLNGHYDWQAGYLCREIEMHAEPVDHSSGDEEGSR